MKKKFRVLLLASFFGLGIALPDCNNQQGMQQKLEAMEASHKELARKIQAIETHLKTVDGDLNEIKGLLPQITNVLTAQKTSVGKLEADVKVVQEALKKKRRL
jgi:peptidoglycan hydrolase CwlO-like protein